MASGVMERPSWEEYFMDIAELVAKRSTCTRRSVGAVVVKERRIIATGYNGAPSGIAHCSQTGCLREALGVPSGEKHELCRGVHAEQNAIIQAARYGVPLSGADLYTTTCPCSICAKMIINSGIKNIYYKSSYSDKMSAEMFMEAGIHPVNIEDVKTQEERDS